MQHTPASPEASVGVCYLTAVADPSADVSDLVVRFVMTGDVGAPEVATRHVRGFEEACVVLRSWMSAMCKHDPPA